MTSIAYEPSIYVVGRQVIDMKAVQHFLDAEGTYWETDTNIPAEMIPEFAGRMCYMSFGDKAGRKENSKYLGHLIDVGHGSVLEHTVFNLIFCDISRSLTHELVRHRAGFGFSQLSQRYVDSGDAKFVMPPAIRGDKELEDIVKSHINDSVERYEALTTKLSDKLASPDSMMSFALGNETITKVISGWSVGTWNFNSLEDLCAAIGNDEDFKSYLKKKTIRERRKAAREAARCVLPNATETKIFVTANARSLRHFVELRGDRAADAEIRQLACELVLVLQREAPNLFGDYTVCATDDGTQNFISLNKTRKV